MQDMILKTNKDLKEDSKKVRLRPDQSHSFTTWLFINTIVYVANTSSSQEARISMQAGISPVETDNVGPKQTGQFSRGFGGFPVNVKNIGSVEVIVWTNC